METITAIFKGIYLTIKSLFSGVDTSKQIIIEDLADETAVIS